jgi:3-ketosteroid 9alpha-monooxygenase subunit A
MAKTAEYGLGEFTFPRGWFMVADAADLGEVPLSVRFFGKDLVLYRGKSGRVVMLDAYCPHMGTHLAKNTTSYVVRDHSHVEGDSIRCPYHAWRFGPDGQCDDIPYAKTIPKAACVRSWPVVERAGAVFVWHDPENKAPDYELPPFAEWDDPSWVRWKFDHLGQMNSHPQEILDNMVDVGHFVPTHGMKEISYFENEFQGHVARQRQGGPHRTLVTGSELLQCDTWYTGPGLLQSRMGGHYDTLMLIAHTPVDDGVIQVWHALMVKSPHAAPTPEDVAAARAYQETSRLAFAQDFDIWSNKAPCFQVLQIPTDGPFDKLRLWYKQFYNRRERAGEFLKRCEGVHRVRGMPHSLAAE